MSDAQPSSQKNSLTLLEVVVVLLVVAALFALLSTKLNEMRERVRRTSCMSLLKQIGLSCQLYAKDNHGTFPYAVSADDSNDHFYLLFPVYLNSTIHFVCPSDANCRQPAVSMSEADFDAPNVCSYAYVAGMKEDSGSDSPLAGDAIADPSRANEWGLTQFQKRSSCTTRGSNHRGVGSYYGGNVLCVDGHVNFQAGGHLHIRWVDADGGTKNIKNPNGL